MSFSGALRNTIMLLAIPALAWGVLSPSSISIGSSANPSIYGAAVTLTATISPSAATGNVTFYDGTNVLGTSKVASGVATLTTGLLASGSRSLKAYYGGDASYGASTSSMLAQTITAVPANGFQAAIDYSMDANPNSAAVGDFNDDGKADIAVANGNNVSVLLGNGNGTFHRPVNYDTGSTTSSVVVGDFNGDGKADLAVGGSGKTVSVLLGNGDGTFQPAANYNIGIQPYSVAMGDFNGDGKPDLAVVGSGGNGVSVLLGIGDGSFQTAVNYVVGNPYSVAVGDFNGDGIVDLAVTDPTGGGSVSVLLGNGNGTFQAAMNYELAGFSYSVAVGDFNGDGRADLAVTIYGRNNVSVLLGNGDGSFQTPVNYRVGTSPTSIIVGDVNGDGKADLALVDYASGSVSVLLGNGDGTFEATVTYDVGMSPTYVALGDFNGDGRADLSISTSGGNNVSVLLGAASAPSGTSLTPAPLPSVSFGKGLSLWASVVGVGAYQIPTGTVRFRDGSFVIGTANLVNANASFTATYLDSGPHTFFADYLGDSVTSPSTSTAAAVNVTGGPQWSIAMAHVGNLTPGQTGVTYTITVANTGLVSTFGTVTVNDPLPNGLILVSMSGPGWTCSGQSCTRNEDLIPGSSFPPITVSVNVAVYAASLTNIATVSGGNAGLGTASDPTQIASPNPPFGLIDTPATVVTGVTGAIGVTGWALSAVGIQSVGLWREPGTGETATANGFIFLGNATMVPGTRPDVAQTYPGYPNNNVGWGAQILTNMLPGGGNGTYRIHALVTDKAGQVVDLGVRSISADNAHAVLPFGTIDSPAEGGTVSSRFLNFGWAVTPVSTNVIPKDGTTIWVYIDNQPVGQPIYNNYRSDLAALFPGLQNSSGAVGYYMLDTATLVNGLHTIAWSVQDSAGNLQGIGSRFFTVKN